MKELTDLKDFELMTPATKEEIVFITDTNIDNESVLQMHLDLEVLESQKNLEITLINLAKLSDEDMMKVKQHLNVIPALIKKKPDDLAISVHRGVLDKETLETLL
jgi:hypothetical protein